MLYNFKISYIYIILGISATLHTHETIPRPKLLIILGSAREHSVSRKLAHVTEQLIDKTHIDCQIIDLQDYNLPIINPEKDLFNSGVDAWRKTFKEASAVIFLLPNYNAGYSGIIKNGIDALGLAAAGKTVGLIGYSGGYDGGKEPVNAILPVLKTLKMNVLENHVLIPMAEGAFNDDGSLKNTRTIDSITSLIVQLDTIIIK